MKNTNPGFNKDQVVVVKIRGRNILNNFETFKNELLQNTNIQNAVYSRGIPGNVNTVLTMFKEGHDAKDSHTIDVIQTDFDFIETYDMQLVKGRSFSPKHSSDTTNVFIVNEAAAEKFGWGLEAIGKKIGFSRDSNRGPIVGIIKDFHYRSLKEKINPMVFELKHEPARFLSLKINTGNLKNTISFVEDKWHEFEKERSFDYFFAGEHFNSLYKSEEKVSMLINLFAGFAIFIASIGLLGLAAFTIEQRTKEIGIRKVLGASVTGLIGLLSNDFLKWVILANIVAWPVAYFIMDSWLMNFAYRININVAIFMMAAVISLILAFITVSFQAIKAAAANPIESLRYE
jgi:putative ABC transport system permease protein